MVPVTNKEEGMVMIIHILLRKSNPNQGRREGTQQIIPSPEPREVTLDTIYKYISKYIVTISVGGRGLQPPKMGRNPIHSGKFSVRIIANLGNFSACSPALFDISGRKSTAPLNLTSSCAHDYNHWTFDYA